MPASRLVVTPPSVAVDVMCNNNVLIYNVRSNLDPKVPAPVDQVWSVPLAGGSPQIVAKSQGGGSLSLHQVTGGWVVFNEYRQHQQSTTADFWYIRLLNLQTEQTWEVRHATQSPALDEIPQPSVAADGRVVWDELTSDQGKVLRVFDPVTSTTSTLKLPAEAYPIHPQWLGQKVAFLDSSTDPDHGREAWLAFGGTVSVADLATSLVSRLDSTPNARNLVASDDVMAWNGSVPNPDGTQGTHWDVRLTTLRKSTRVLTMHGAQPRLGHGLVAWYDYQENRLHIYSTATDRDDVVAATVPSPVPFDICQNSIFYQQVFGSEHPILEVPTT